MEKRDPPIVTGLFWKLLERFGVMCVQFVLQLLLARLLEPEHYGVLSLMLIFSALATVFIEQGLAAALVQSRDVTEADLSSVFWVTLAVAGGLYLIGFAAAPLIGAFYGLPGITAPFRVLCLTLFPGALNSVQLAIVSRRLDFKLVFRSSMIAVTGSGVAGILLALLGAGLWSLVIQSLLNALIGCAVLWFCVKWRPRHTVDPVRIRVLFAYGWKLLASGLLDALYQDAQSLAIGKKYSADALGYCSRGKQFPQLAIGSVNSALQSVLLPAMSARQDNTDVLKSMTRNAVSLSGYIIFPIMAGLAGIAEPLIRLLLTEKWLPCVPFLRIFCLSFAFYPVYAANLQAVKAMGRSDIFLKQELIKKGFGLLLLAVSVFCFDTPLAIALTGVTAIPFDFFVNAMPAGRLTGYSCLRQLKDLAPSAALSGIMLLLILPIPLLGLGVLPTLLLQIITGGGAYLLLSAALQPKPYRLLLRAIKQHKRK